MTAGECPMWCSRAAGHAGECGGWLYVAPSLEVDRVAGVYLCTLEGDHGETLVHVEVPVVTAGEVPRALPAHSHTLEPMAATLERLARPKAEDAADAADPARNVVHVFGKLHVELAREPHAIRLTGMAGRAELGVAARVPLEEVPALAGALRLATLFASPLPIPST